MYSAELRVLLIPKIHKYRLISNEYMVYII